MAVTIFSRAAGVVASFNDPTMPSTAAVRLENWGGFSTFKSIITRVSLSSQCNFQFLHTLGGNIYIYVFGDKVGQLSVSGVAFDSSCESTGGTVGIETILSYYNANRLTARQTPMKITLGAKTTLSTYLVGVTGDVLDPGLKMWQFSLQFVLIPQNSVPCSAVEGVAASPSTPATGGGDTAPAGGFVAQNPSVNRDGSYTDISKDNIVASGYSATVVGPNTNMVRAQVQ